MIKLTLIEKPKELTAEKEAELVAIFKETEAPVWQKKYIKDALLKMTNNKCAYSEQRLNECSAYMEVEHFKCKSKYPDEVVRWGNLLPSCNQCNAKKGETDVEKTPIVNPLVDNPKDYLYIRGLMYFAIEHNTKGENTKRLLDLNNESHFINPKMEIRKDLEEKFLLILKNPTDIDSLRILKTTLEKYCRPETVFSATFATYILYESKTYEAIENYLKNNGFWDNELENLKSALLEVAMPNPKKI